MRTKRRSRYNPLKEGGWDIIDVGWVLTIGVEFLIVVIGLKTDVVGKQEVMKFDQFLSLKPSEMGDTFAGIFSALAFIWIIITVFMQSQELREQRTVLREQKDEFIEQNKNLKSQIFENTFSNMLSTLGEIIEAIDLNNIKHGRTTGRDCFRIYYYRLEAHMDGGSPVDFDMSNDEFFKEYGHEFGHYFRFLYNFFRFIDQSEHTKKHHMRVLRAFLSDYELLLIYYNCLTPTGQNFRNYIVDYAVFDNLQAGKLLDIEHLSHYPQAAFGKNREYDYWRAGTQ